MAGTSFFVIGPFGFPIFAKIDRVLPLWLINGRVKYKFLIWASVSKLCETQALACGGDGDGDGGVIEKHNSPEFLYFMDIIIGDNLRMQIIGEV